ncbi:AAA family ATPase [Alkalibaculum sp. M08DMB]|uniref:AAA family ATPase n=1 Tax=Alkalibaculum sporogenes TaxID=2655001 RepID=A0A6A7KDP1_9FIRM|nr:RNA polymerase recycling motor HelD [Alkalibaculum sporogenes]MPW27143.1 AAA family ATPase [Alkalibaculum sporogenes]
MPIRDHLDYLEELERLEQTVEYIQNAITASGQNKNTYKEEIKDAYIHLDFLDSSQSYASIMLHSTLLNDLERNLENLLKAKTKPYFARIDFCPEGDLKGDKFYIGKMSLLRAEWDIPFILDWRSPLASVYYDGRIGSVSYQSETGTMRGELTLKRQYTINDAKLENIMDIDITATDDFLQASLEDHKDNRLKDIVSTIQSEQNAIIRADIDKPLVVQGVAGSGKTTIALHRIAYLIYTYEDSFDPENFMIIAPNQLFLNYISDVLPELGADKVIQATYTDFVFEQIGKKYKSIDSDEKLLSIISPTENTDTHNIHFLKQASLFKGSMLFKKIITRYIEEIESRFIPDQDIVLGGYNIISASDIKNMFLVEYCHLPLYKRLDQIKKHITFKLKSQKNKIIEGIENFYDIKIEYLRDHEIESEERRIKIVELLDLRDNDMNIIKKGSTTIVKKYMTQFKTKDLFSYYSDLITDENKMHKFSRGILDTKFVAYLCRTSKDILSKKKVEFEDLAALLYLKHRVLGFENKLDIKYVVIDEAQDFSLFQFFALKEVFNTEMFTILGDVSQGIHSYRSIQNWDYVINEIFDASKSQYLKLEQSYRTTIEIMGLANEVIKLSAIDGLILAKPVVRHGENPTINQLSSDTEILEKVEKRITTLIIEGYKSIAIIGKTSNECIHIQKQLERGKQIKTKLLKGKEEQYDHNIVVVPSYLAKGLEFDAVIIVNIKDSYKKDEIDLKLLYVAMTRALHRLDIYYKKGTIDFLDKTTV